MTIPDLRETIAAVRRDGRNRDTRCPAHDDHRASLSVGLGDDGRILLHCHAGCAFDAIMAAAGLRHADIFPESKHSDTGPRRIVGTYDYRDERGELLSQAVRFDPKGFRQRRPDGAGGWVWDLNGVRRVLYRLPDLPGRQTVLIAEGEKDVDHLWRLGLPATTNAGGAGKWRRDYTAQLKAAGCQHVVVLPDNDPAGETHGRDVARSCAAGGLAVKLLPLPGLPAEGGDVSDFLAAHSKTELLALIKEAPVFDPTRSVTQAQPIVLTSLAELLNEPEDPVAYIVEERIPAGAVVLFAAAPKTGKSTAARALALAVSRGEPWLGWATTAGAVWLLAFEDKRSAIRAHFRQMGATGQEPIRLFVDQAPTDLLPRLQELAAKERPALIIVDTLGRLIRAKDFNDYAEITKRFEPLLKLSRTTGATLLLLHHGSAHVNREGLDAVLGSTAVSGSVDNILLLKRLDQQRVLSSVQRIGPDLQPTIITLDTATGRLARAGSKQQFDDRELSDRILVLLRDEAEPVREKRIQEHVEGRNADKVRVLRRLVGMGLVDRLGAGGQKDPYRYRYAAATRRPVEPVGTGHPLGTEDRPVNSGFAFESETSVPDVPYIYPEQGNNSSEDLLRTTPLRTSSSNDSHSVVPVVPGRCENRTAEAPATAVSPHKHEANSCSHEGDYERF
jgi:hypothetical protein